MNITFGILIAIGSISSFYAYLPFSVLIDIFNDKYNESSRFDRLLKKLKLKNVESYKELVNRKNSFTIYSIVLLNFVCFISQFFNVSHDLKVVILIINILFLLGVLLNLCSNKYLKSYILLLQNSISTGVAVKNYFKIEPIETMPEQYKCYGEFMKIKDKLYYHKCDTKLVLKLKNKYNKKVGSSELDYIVDQLNNLNVDFNGEIRIKSLYKVPQLINYSKFIVNESAMSKFLPKGLKLFNKFYLPTSIFLSLLYLSLVVFSIAACCGTDWFYWFPI